MSLAEFFEAILKSENGGLRIAVLLILGVIFVNGWTDAPNAITASVSTGALSLRGGVIIAAVFNFIGALVMGALNTSVLRSVGEITMMIEAVGERSLSVLAAALIAIIVWAIIAWFFGIPTSESHALLSGIFGAALASGASITEMNITAIKLAVLGLFISLPIGFFGGLVIGKLLDIVLYNTKSKRKYDFVKRMQITGASAMAFMHGAQDSQKFAGVLVASVLMSGTCKENIKDSIPIWLTLLCAVVISLGTSVGGYRIIKKVGMETVSLTGAKGLAADISGAFSMLLASYFGIPVSTTHTATASVIGAGISYPPRHINMRSVKEMLVAWILTFPCCGLISYCSVKIFLLFT